MRWRAEVFCLVFRQHVRSQDPFAIKNNEARHPRGGGLGVTLETTDSPEAGD